MTSQFNIEIAEKIFGWKWFSTKGWSEVRGIKNSQGQYLNHTEVPPFNTMGWNVLDLIEPNWMGNIGEAWQVVEKLNLFGNWHLYDGPMELYHSSDDDTWDISYMERNTDHRRWIVQKAPTAAVALCLAGLWVVDHN